MGINYDCKCSQCGFEGYFSVGVGMLFPRVYQKTMEQARAGMMGEILQNFLTRFPDGVLNAETVAKVCLNCGTIDSVQDLSMYIPKKDIEKPNPDDAIWNLEAYYELYSAYPHKCDKCGADCDTVSDREAEKMKCPLCHAEMKITPYLFWD